jgi:hypothetical protein
LNGLNWEELAVIRQWMTRNLRTGPAYPTKPSDGESLRQAAMIDINEALKSVLDRSPESMGREESAPMVFTQMQMRIESLERLLAASRDRTKRLEAILEKLAG